MNFEELKVRYAWFKEHASDLEDMAEIMDCLEKEISGISFTISATAFRGLRQPYADVREQLTTAPKSLQGGVRTLEHYEENIRRTGANYLQNEADNEATANQIKALMEQDGFTED